ncbi:MAG: thioredoxin family protein [Rhodospirillales bacterium]
MKRMMLAAAFVCAALLPAQEFQLGSRVSEFTLQDVQGNPVQFSKLKGDVTVIGFIATQCPVSNAYNERMKALYNDYAPKGVKFVFINSNRTEPGSEVAAHARQHGFPFAVYKDENNRVADQFGATVTPEMYVLDSTGVIRYHGSIDDSQEVSRVKAQRLRSALDAVLAGRPVETAQTKAFGCTIKKVRKES